MRKRGGVEELDVTGLQRVLRPDDEQSVAQGQPLEDLRSVPQMVRRRADVGANRLAHERVVVAREIGPSDVHPDDDACPRQVTPPGVVDTYPDGKIVDKGCGTKKADKTFGDPVLVDVVVK